MISQGFPLYATTEDASAPGVWAVVGWTPVGNSGALRPIMTPLDGLVRNAIVPNDALAWTFTTQDPREAAHEWASNREVRDAVAAADERGIRVSLRLIADRLDEIGATGPAREIREVLEPGARTNMAARYHNLVKRMAALADEIDRPRGPTNLSRRIREELNK